MASTLPVQAFVKSTTFLHVKHRAPPPFLLLLFLLLLLLSLLLALALQLHINDFLTPTLSNPPLFHFLSPLLFDDNPSSLLHIQQHYLGSILSPCTIFILANFIIFTLLVKSFYLSSSSSLSYSSDFSDFTSEKSQFVPEHDILLSHHDFFLSSPYQHYVLSPDSPEEYPVLPDFSKSGESTYYTNVQSYNKLSNRWEKVRGISMDPYVSSNAMSEAVAQKKATRPADKVMMMEKAQSKLAVAVAAAPAFDMLSVEQGKAVEKAGARLRLDAIAKTSRSVNVGASDDSRGSQVVDVHMEPHVARCTTVSTTPSHPHPPAVLAPSRKPTRVTPVIPLNTSTTPAQRPPSSLKVKKSLQSSGGFVNMNPQSRMVRSYSDQQLTQKTISPEATTALTSLPSSHMEGGSSSSSPSSSSLTKGPHMQRAQSLRSSSAIAAQVKRSPSFSESLDGLSDAEANKLFSDFIAHRFALMKKELDHS